MKRYVAEDRIVPDKVWYRWHDEFEQLQAIKEALYKMSKEIHRANPEQDDDHKLSSLVYMLYRYIEKYTTERKFQDYEDEVLEHVIEKLHDLEEYIANDFFSGFLNDAERDKHLQTIEQLLLDLEATIDNEY